MGNGPGLKEARKPSPRSRRALTPRPAGWATTDADEIAARRERAAEELMRIQNLEPEEPVFATFRVRSASGTEYTVEVRSLTDMENTCSCPDFRTNGLGTCKHIEALLSRLQRKPEGRRAAKRESRSPRAEIFLRRTGEPEVVLSLPENGLLTSDTLDVLHRYFDDRNLLQGDPAEAVPSLVRALDGSTRQVRISNEVVVWATDRARRVAREVERQAFLDEQAREKRSLDLLKLPLYPYQVDGMLHLAFGERVLLGDEMGLGKTAQAVAACALLKERRGIERVLIVCPVSLKAEWEEQIEKFTDLPLRFVLGTKPNRLACYDSAPFFSISNYEQVLRDVADINTRLRPDVVILDEAQRIKNWNTRTARTLKRLESSYAFLLTGTPLENRIDEIYSIVEFLDPHIFGPLFRFNREFYQLDDRGRPVGYQNLEEMQRRIRPLLLRRRKDQIETQLPERVDNNYFVPMSAPQLELYDDYKMRVVRILGILKRRPLTREEQEKLQRWLACMRMLCDTPYILTPNTRDCPKVHELEAILEDLDVRGTNKAIIFSEWARMLELVRELCRAMNLDFAWHTGSVPQMKRREEIRRFKTDPNCRVFLSTDSGGLGLNLQAASVVINLDLPWNPARLEQRIARAWRKHQTRSVHVVNLISEGTIEHQMLGTLAAKRALADAILDGRGDVGELRMPSARQSFLDRLQLIFDTAVQPSDAVSPPPPATPLDRFRTVLEKDVGQRLLALHIATSESATGTALVIVDRPGDGVEEVVAKQWPEWAAQSALPAEVEVIDSASWAALQRLVQRGLIPGLPGCVMRGPDGSPEAEARRKERSAALLIEARRRIEMAGLLQGGGFASEAAAPAREAAEGALLAAAIANALIEDADGNRIPESLLRGEMLARGILSADDVAAVERLRAGPGSGAEGEANPAQRFVTECKELLERLAAGL